MYGDQTMDSLDHLKPAPCLMPGDVWIPLRQVFSQIDVFGTHFHTSFPNKL